MTSFTNTNTPRSHSSRIQDYYKFHSGIYDLSRWTFLFGRNKILKMIGSLPSQPRILEIGCGTGRNIKRLGHKFPGAEIVGLDLSTDMLKVAEKKIKSSKKVQLINANYLSDDLKLGSFDIILLSYSLTMFGNQAEYALDRIFENLKPGGYLAVVDFNTTPVHWFRQWMKINHVDFTGQFLPLLQNNFHSIEIKVNQAYMGLWSYFLFLGQRN